MRKRYEHQRPQRSPELRETTNEMILLNLAIFAEKPLKLEQSCLHLYLQAKVYFLSILLFQIRSLNVFSLDVCSCMFHMFVYLNYEYEYGTLYSLY